MNLKISWMVPDTIFSLEKCKLTCFPNTLGLNSIILFRLEASGRGSKFDYLVKLVPHCSLRHFNTNRDNYNR